MKVPKNMAFTNISKYNNMILNSIIVSCYYIKEIFHMARPYTGKVVESIEERTQKNGDVYVYRVRRWYDPDSRNTRRKYELLGIKDPDSGKIKKTRPKRRNGDLVPSATPVASELKGNGMISIIRHFSEAAGVTGEVIAALPEDEGSALKILTLAWFDFATDGMTWTRAVKWTSDYLPLLPYKHGSISKNIYTSLFHFIGRNEGIKWSIFKARAARFQEGELIAWDSTVYECNVKGVHDGIQGATKDGLIRRIYKVFFFYSITSRKLLSFVKIPGNVADCTTVPYAISMMKALDLKKPEILQDNGYTDDNTIGELLHQKFHFVTRILPSARWIKDGMDKYRDALTAGMSPSQMIYSDAEFSGVFFRVRHTFRYTRVYKSTRKGIEAGERDEVKAYVNVFVYFSTYKKGLEDRAFRERFANIRADILAGSVLDAESKAFREQYMTVVHNGDGLATDVLPIHEKVEAHFRNHGFLVLVADHEKDIEKALQKYRTREKIEERIKGHKSHTGGDTSKTGSDEFLEGELLVEFLADTLRESMLVKLAHMEAELGVPNGESIHDSSENMKIQMGLKKWLRRNSIANILDAFDTTSIEEVTSNGKSSKMTDSTTARDRLFLQELGINDWGKAPS